MERSYKKFINSPNDFCLWDSTLGKGYTKNEIVKKCNGDMIKAFIVFEDMYFYSYDDLDYVLDNLSEDNYQYMKEDERVHGTDVLCIRKKSKLGGSRKYLTMCDTHEHALECAKLLRNTGVYDSVKVMTRMNRLLQEGIEEEEWKN